MKILFYNHTGQVSGAERVLLMILSRLDQRRFESVVVCPADGQLIGMVRDLNVRAIDLEQLEARFTWSVSRLLRYVASFVRVIRKARSLVINELPDIIHANSIRAGLVMSAATLGLDVPVVWHAHDILPRHPLSTAVRLFAGLTSHNCILGVSHAVANCFRGIILRLFRRRMRIDVIHNAVDLERFRPDENRRNETRRALGITEKEQVIAIVGHLTPNKGQLELIEAFAALSRKSPAAVLLIVGGSIFNPSADYSESLRLAVTSFAITDRVRFLGPRDDMPNLMRSFDLLVVNSRTEAFPLTVLEGLSSGISVLATAVGGTPEMIQHAENGWLIPARDTKALTDAILKLLSDAELRERLGLNARETALARFSTNRYLGELESLYARTLESGEKGHRVNVTKNLKVELSAD